MLSPRLALMAVGYGLLIWFEATLIIRWAGDLIFVPESVVWTIGGFAITAAIVFACGWFFFATFQTAPPARAAAAIVICATGLLANVAVFAWINAVFPKMTFAQQQLFTCWVAWSYGLGLLTGVWPRNLARVPAA